MHTETPIDNTNQTILVEDLEAGEKKVVRASLDKDLLSAPNEEPTKKNSKSQPNTLTQKIMKKCCLWLCCKRDKDWEREQKIAELKEQKYL